MDEWTQHAYYAQPLNDAYLEPSAMEWAVMSPQFASPMGYPAGRNFSLSGSSNPGLSGDDEGVVASDSLPHTPTGDEFVIASPPEPAYAAARKRGGPRSARSDSDSSDTKPRATAGG